MNATTSRTIGDQGKGFGPVSGSRPAGQAASRLVASRIDPGQGAPPKCSRCLDTGVVLQFGRVVPCYCAAAKEKSK